MHCAIFPLTFDLLLHIKVPCYLEHEIVEHFDELSSVFNIVDEGGQPCHYEDEHNSIHGNDTDVPENHGNHTSEHEHEEFCQSVYFLIRKLLLDLNMTTPSCLENGTVKTLEEDPVAKVTAVDPGIGKETHMHFVCRIVEQLSGGRSGC